MAPLLVLRGIIVSLDKISLRLKVDNIIIIDVSEKELLSK